MQTYLDETPPEDRDEIWVYFTFVSSATFYERYPETLAFALSSIGGILGLVNIGLFLNWFHNSKFEKDLQKMIKKSQ